MSKSRYLEILTSPIGRNNPITVQVLGICSALAVTVKLQPAIVMALSVTFVTAMSNVVISLLRNTIPTRIRIIVQLVIVATLVIIVDQFLKAYVFDVSKQLSVFVGLIITNCIIMGRLEAFALSHNVCESFVDGVGNGIGYGLILVLIAFFRELLSNGTIWDVRVIPEAFYEAGYVNNSFMLMPPAALIIAGIIIWIQRSCRRKTAQNK